MKTTCTHGDTRPCPRCLARESPWSGQPINGAPERMLPITIGSRFFELKEGGAGNLGLYLWPTAFALAVQIPAFKLGRTVLELGAGLGLPGMVAASCGAQVTFCERDPVAALRLVDVLEHHQCAGAVVPGDWRFLQGEWDSVIGSDMLRYGDTRQIVEVIDGCWNRRGCLLLGDCGSDKNPSKVSQDLVNKFPAIRRYEVPGRMADNRVFHCDLWKCFSDKHVPWWPRNKAFPAAGSDSFL